jgi:DNA-binding NtrC family response regulator
MQTSPVRDVDSPFRPLLSTAPAPDLPRPQKRGVLAGMIGRSRAMLEVYELIERVAPTAASVLVTGESGSGKELVAEAIHGMSTRSRAVFLPVNCGAVSSTLFESELFGHERGSFTGADRRRIGYFERASGGTLLLDEVTEMSLDLQAKLLRVLETGALLRVGSSEPIQINVRIIATTNRDPRQAVEQGRLREDLFYRLNVFPIDMPPLRSRGDDISLLAEHFLAELNRQTDSTKSWGDGALERLNEMTWPGNVRELRSAVHRAFILGDAELHADSFGEPSTARPNDAIAPLARATVGISIAMAEQELILATLERLGGRKPEAAKVLGISLKTLYSRVNMYRARGVTRGLGE